MKISKLRRLRVNVVLNVVLNAVPGIESCSESCYVWHLMLIRRVKIKISSKSVRPVVLISSSICESEGSTLNKHSATPLVHNVHCLCSLAIHRHRPRSSPGLV